MMTGLEVNRVHQALSVLMGQEKGTNRTLQLVADYNVPQCF